MSESDKWTVGRLLSWTTEFLSGQGATSARLDAEILLAASLDNLVVHRFDDTGATGLALNHPKLP